MTFNIPEAAKAAPAYTSRTVTRSVAPRVSKGHDSVIGALQESKRTVTLVLLSGDRLVGTIISRDKYTITVLSNGTRFIVYKHAIEMFFGDESKRT